MLLWLTEPNPTSLIDNCLNPFSADSKAPTRAVKSLNIGTHVVKGCSSTYKLSGWRTILDIDAYHQNHYWNWERKITDFGTRKAKQPHLYSGLLGPLVNRHRRFGPCSPPHGRRDTLTAPLQWSKHQTFESVARASTWVTATCGLKCFYQVSAMILLKTMYGWKLIIGQWMNLDK